MINLLTGVLSASAGRILLQGEDITRLDVHRRVARGLARTFQINQLFLDLSPIETVGLAVSQRLGVGAQWWRMNTETVLTPAEYKTGDVIYPFEKAKAQ